LETGFTLLEAMVVVAIIAILAGTAIPAFAAHMRRAKSAEAIAGLDRIYKGAATYFMTSRVSAGSGEVKRCQFPKATPWTPALGGNNCCGGTKDKDDDGRCDADLSQWDSPSWNAVDFEMAEQHDFHFRMTVKESASMTRISARAGADLDCDGEHSMYIRAGYGVRSTDTDCRITGSSAFFVEKGAE
jgi:prepilin-type N-terminal cleavage/methylation domain-containing protein